MISKVLGSFFGKAPDNSHIKILVVDDSLVDQKVVLAAVRKGGYSVFKAEDGKTALQLANEVIPDLIVLDYNLPDIKGPQICHTLKQSDRTKSIPVLFLTSMDSPSSIINCYEEGGDNYLAKPINPGFLLKQIDLTLKERKK